MNSAVSIKCALPAETAISYCMTFTPQRMAPGGRWPQLYGKDMSEWLLFSIYSEDGNEWGDPQVGGLYTKRGMAGSARQESINPRFYLYLNPMTTSAGGMPSPAGFYQNSFLIRLHYNYANKNITDPQQLCAAAPPQGTLTAPDQYMIIQATAEKSCRIYAVSGVNFGRHYRLDNVPAQTGKIAVACTVGLVYRLGISSGQNAQNGKRAMRCRTPETCGSSLIYYDIYRAPKYSAGGVWGDDWNDENSIIKNVSNSLNDAHAYSPIARLYPGQAAPPVGAYRDTVVITIRTDMD